MNLPAMSTGSIQTCVFAACCMESSGYLHTGNIGGSWGNPLGKCDVAASCGMYVRSIRIDPYDFL